MVLPIHKKNKVFHSSIYNIPLFWVSKLIYQKLPFVESSLLECCIFLPTLLECCGFFCQLSWSVADFFAHSLGVLRFFLPTLLECCGFFLPTLLECCGFFPLSWSVAVLLAHSLGVLRFFLPTLLECCGFFAHSLGVLRFFLPTLLECCVFFCQLSWNVAVFSHEVKVNWEKAQHFGPSPKYGWESCGFQKPHYDLLGLRMVDIQNQIQNVWPNVSQIQNQGKSSADFENHTTWWLLSEPPRSVVEFAQLLHHFASKAPELPHLPNPLEHWGVFAELDFHLWAQPAHEAGQGEHILQPWTIALSHFLAGFHFVSSTPSLNHFKNKTIFKLQSFCLEEAVFGALRL